MIRLQEIPLRQFIARRARYTSASPSAHVELNSAPRGGVWSRWSYFPAPARLLLRCDPAGERTELRGPEGVRRAWADPLEAMCWLGEQITEQAGPGPRFKTGWAGYLSYDLGQRFERFESRAADDLRFPLFEFTYHNEVLAYDHAEGKAYLIQADDARRGDGYVAMPGEVGQDDAPPRCGFTRSGYEAAVRTAIGYIQAGDIYQVNLSQRFSSPLRKGVRAVYARLRRRYPAWFGACLIYGDHALLCNSPELFLRITPDGNGGRHVLTRPIKGTRPRLGDMARRLDASEKDQAELTMIVDLERNDLGRICRLGSVRVSEMRIIEAHPTVYHGVATVEGMLCDEAGWVQILASMFPGGSVTGAPKIRAMQIIEEIEPVRRGPYCGAIGYLSADGHIDFNIAIRTMLASGGRLHMPVGGGIVADSTPADEYEETLVKAAAMFHAAGKEAGPAFQARVIART